MDILFHKLEGLVGGLRRGRFGLRHADSMCKTRAGRYKITGVVPRMAHGMKPRGPKTAQSGQRLGGAKSCEVVFVRYSLGQGPFEGISSLSTVSEALHTGVHQMTCASSETEQARDGLGLDPLKSNAPSCPLEKRRRGGLRQLGS